MTTDKVFWAPLWHIYQPPVQTKEWLLKITEQSYRQIINIYSEFPNAKFTLNINASLTQLLMDNGLWDVIEGFKKLAENGQLEFVSTPSFHVICPLLPEKEVIRQIKLNDKINRKAFGKCYRPKGVWLPEMAYSPDVIPAIRKAGYEWICLSGVASNGKWTNKGYYTVRKGKYSLKVIFRDDVISLDIGFGRINSDFADKLSKNKGTYCFTALDGETIGHHIPSMVEGMRETLRKIQNNPEIMTLNCSDIFEKFEYLGEIEALPSSWSTTYEDIQSGNYFPLWMDKLQEPFRTIHQLGWNHLYLLIDTYNLVKNKVNGNRKVRNYFKEARNLIDKGEHSCMFWWFTRDTWHRDSVKFLAGLELQSRAFIKLQQAFGNEESVIKNIEKANVLKDSIFEKMNNSL